MLPTERRDACDIRAARGRPRPLSAHFDEVAPDWLHREDRSGQKRARTPALLGPRVRRVALYRRLEACDEACETVATNPRCAGKGGFSLVELMVVLVLVGIMAAMIIPEMKGTFEEALLRSTARKLVAVFNLAGSQAVTMNELHRVRLDRKTGRYFLERTSREGEPGSRFVPVRDAAGGEGELDTRITIEIRRPVTDASGPGDQEGRMVAEGAVQTPSQGEAISFYPDGTADAGEVLLRDREGFRLALQINPTTARIRIVELERE